MKKVKEPDLIELKTKSDLIHLINQYNDLYGKDEAKDFLITYAVSKRKEKVNAIRSIVPQNVVSTYGWVARFLTRGIIDTIGMEEKLNRYLDSLLESTEDKKIEVRKVVKPEYDINSFLGLLDEKLDEYITKNKPFNISEEVKKADVPLKFHSQVKGWVDARKEEYSVTTISFTITEEGKLPQKIEERIYPSYLTDTKIKRLLSFLEFEIVKQKKTFTKKKRVDPNKQVQKLKYQLQDSSLNIQSVNPVHIVGSKLCVTYNTKNRLLSIFKSNIASGLMVKGNSIYNYNESIGKKKLRNPMEDIKQFLQCSKEQIVEIFDSLSCKVQKSTGQFSNETLILRVE
jgi:hypothetical protein